MQSVRTSGTLSDISCPRLLAHLHRTRFDGTLRIARGALLKLFYFQGGEIAMASSNDQGDHLAPILIRDGKLRPEQMDLARKSTKPGTSLARVLVQMGFLTSGELFAGARQQLRQIVGSVIGMTDAAYEIQPGFFPREVTSLNVDTREMLLDLISNLSDRSFVLLEVGAPDTVYSPIAGSGNGGDAPRLPKAWKTHAERFRSSLAIHDFGQAASLDDFSASKVVYGLSLLGCIEPRSTETASEAPDAEPEVSADLASAPLPETVSKLSDAPAPGLEPVALESTPVSPAPVRSESESIVEPIPSFRERFNPGKGAEASGAIPEPSPPLEAAQAEETAPEAEIHPARLDADEKAPGSGPIRLEFREPFPTRLPPVKPSRAWTMLSVLGGMALLALTSYWFIFLRAPRSGTVQTDSSASEPPAQASDQEAAPPSESLEGTPSSAPESSQPTGTEDPQKGEAKAQESPAPGPTEIPGESPPAPAGTAPAAQPSPSAPRQAGGASAAAAGSFQDARQRLEAGEYATAAKSWSKALAARADAGFTVQIAIVCQGDTLRKAANRTLGSTEFFVLPFALGNRACYRMCWGDFDDLASAQAGSASVPRFFIEEGGQPVVISFRKALPAEGR